MKYKDWNNFMVSCSRIKDIMSKPKGCSDLTKQQTESYNKLKNTPDLSDAQKKTLSVLNAKIERFNDPELSSSAIKYLLSRYSWEKYNKGTLPSEQKSSYKIKGNELEKDAIDFISKNDGVGYIRQSEFINNGYIYGRADVLSPDKTMVIDIKVSWSIHSFLPNNVIKLSEKYWWQCQGYMEIYGCSKAQVRFVLLNTPPTLVERERIKYTEKYMLGEIDSENFEESIERLDLCYDYTKIPDKRKVIVFEMNKEPDVIEFIKKKVIRCREWMKWYDKVHTKNEKILISHKDYAIFSKENNTEYNTADPCQGYPE